MVALLEGSPELAKIFGTATFDKFESEFPPYSVVQSAVNDPSVRRDAGLDNAGAMMGMLCKDLQSGSRAMVWKLAVTTGDFVGNQGINLPSRLMPGLEALVASVNIPGSLTAAEVTNVVLATAKDPKQGAKLAGKVALGIALTAIGTAVPLVGAIGAAVVAFVGALIGLLKAGKTGNPLTDPALRNELYRRFPPLQTQDGDLDTQLVNKALLTRLVSQDWTGIYLPRFTGSWLGLERGGGFAFARGNPGIPSKNFNEEIQTFVPSLDGLGVLPGTNQCTSVLQISLDPAGNEMAEFFAYAGKDPREQKGAADRIVDTGGFYLALGRLAGLAWDWATKPDSPYQYRLDAVRMHKAWKEHCDSGIQFIKDIVFPWWGINLEGSKIRGAANLEGFYGSAVYAAIGSWGCALAGGTTNYPIFAPWMGTLGFPADALADNPVDLYPGSQQSGAFLPIQNPPTSAFQACMSTIYDRTPNIRGTLDALQQQQRFALKHSLVSAYVRHDDAAFAGDLALQDLLGKQRAMLLQHEDRKFIDMRDVSPTEVWNGENWRDALLAAGVPKKPSVLASFGLKISKTDEPRPEVPGVQPGPPVPWEQRPLRRPRPASSSSAPAIVGATGAAILGAAWLWRIRQRRKNFVDQSPAPVRDGLLWTPRR